MPPSSPAQRPGLDLLQIEDQLTSDERLVRDTVRAYTAEKVMPHIADWFEAGILPRELAPELGKMGLLGMHLSGYGCAGMGPVAYGVACRELEAADTGLRSLVSVQGSLAMYPIWRYGSDEQKDEWLPRMATGEALGCFGLTEPDHGSDPGSMKTNAKPDGTGWVLSGTKMWITNGAIADVAVVWARTPDGIRGFLVPRGARGFTSRSIHKKMSLRASVTAELHFDEVKLPADAMLPGVSGLKGPLSCLTEARFGIAWGVLGSARSCLETAVEYARTREQFGKPIGGFQLTQGKLAWMFADLTRAQLLAMHIGRLKEAARSPRSRSASRRWPTCGPRSTSPGRPGRSSALTGSRWNIRSSGTPTTWSRYSPTRARRRSTPWRSATPSPASPPTAEPRLLA